MLNRLKNIAIISTLIFQSACSQVSIRDTAHSTELANKSRVIAAARHQLGTEYKYGGASPAEGFDCSGLVFYSFQQAGISLPRTTYGQLKGSRPVARQNLKPGDLVFFRIYRSRVSHVGIYLGKNRFIHAPATGKSVSVARLDSPYWKKHFIRAGRIQGPGQGRRQTY